MNVQALIDQLSSPALRAEAAAFVTAYRATRAEERQAWDHMIRRTNEALDAGASVALARETGAVPAGDA